MWCVVEWAAEIPGERDGVTRNCVTWRVGLQVRETWTREPKKKAEIRNDGRMENLKKKGGIKQNINMPFGRCADFEKEKLNDESLKRRCHAYLPV